MQKAWQQVRKFAQECGGEAEESCTKDEGFGSNDKKQQDKAMRQEIHGKVQLQLAEKLLDISKDYSNSAKGRTDFWRAVKPIIGDLNRKRCKKLMLRAKRIRARVEVAKGGLEGSVKRGYNHITKAWLEHATSKAMREFGAGRKWYFGAHQKYLQRWHDLERRRGHAIDRSDLKHEWIDQLIVDIKTLEASSEKFTEEEKSMWKR